MAAAGSMRGGVGTHESKRRRVEAEGREDEETRQSGPGDTRAHGIAAHGTAAQGHAMEEESTAAKENMRGLSTEDGTEDRGATTLEGARREQDDEEDGEEGAPRHDGAGEDGSETATESRQQQHTASEDTQPSSVHRKEEGGVKEGYKGRARRGREKEGGYYPTKRRKTTHATGKEKSTAQKKQADDGSGRGKVALENTIVVGRVYIQRMERKGKNRRDAGRPPGEPG